jgi:hypothetical protein
MTVCIPTTGRSGLKQSWPPLNVQPPRMVVAVDVVTVQRKESTEMVIIIVGPK